LLRPRPCCPANSPAVIPAINIWMQKSSNVLHYELYLLSTDVAVSAVSHGKNYTKTIRSV